MSSWELGEHAGYLGDRPRIEAFRRALVAVLGGGARSVLDLGAGSGILGLLAARAGARVVYAVDSGPIIGPAADVAARSPDGDRIVHIHGRSTEIALPERVDVAVCDQMGGFVHDGGVLRFFADARRRLLAEDAILVPAAFRLYLAPAECRTVREQIDLWGSAPEGFDFGPFRELAVNTEHYVSGGDVRLLGAGVQVAEIASDHLKPIAGEGVAKIDLAGRCDGLAGWFEADLGHGVVLTNRPDDPGRMKRWCNLYPIDQGRAIAEGDTVTFSVDVRPLLNAVTWQVTLEGGDGARLAHERHSTLLGAFVSPDELVRAGGAPVAATTLGRAVSKMFELADGTRKEAEIMDELRRRYQSELESPWVEKALREILRRFSTPLAAQPETMSLRLAYQRPENAK